MEAHAQYVHFSGLSQPNQCLTLFDDRFANADEHVCLLRNSDFVLVTFLYSCVVMASLRDIKHTMIPMHRKQTKFEQSTRKLPRR